MADTLLRYSDKVLHIRLLHTMQLGNPPINFVIRKIGRVGETLATVRVSDRSIEYALVIITSMT